MTLAFHTYPLLPVRPSRTVRPTTREIIAHRMTREAVSLGLLPRESCCVCGGSRLMQAHHEDYHRPNWVAWLCTSCHRSRHRELGWGLTSGTLDHLRDNQPAYHQVPDVHHNGIASRSTSAASIRLIHENKEWEMLWLLKEYGTVEIKTGRRFSHLLKSIYDAVVQKHQLHVITTPGLLRITSPT